MNQWVRDALAHWGQSGQRLSEELAKKMRRSYDRSMIQKMTTTRKVSKAEAEAIAQITGYPSGSVAPIDEYAVKLARLKKDHQDIVCKLIDQLDRESSRSDDQ